MKASIIASTLALFGSTLAAPTLSSRQTTPAALFTFRLTNDVTGASGASSVTINAGPVALRNIFPWATNLLRDGRLIATSAENINPAVQNVFCIFTTPAGSVIRINDEVTFADLDGVDGRAVETDVGEFTIQCEQ